MLNFCRTAVFKVSPTGFYEAAHTVVCVRPRFLLYIVILQICVNLDPEGKHS